MENSDFYLTAVCFTGAGYLFGAIQSWRLAKKLERLRIKPSEWEEPPAKVIEDVGATIGRSIT